MSAVESTRFLRPHDLGSLRRNQRRVQLRRVLIISANLLLVAILAISITWTLQQVHRDKRFAIDQISFEGAKHTDQASLAAVARHWYGSNLFELDIEKMREQLTSLPWIASVGIEKRVPDGVIVRIEERKPVALTRGEGGRLRYVDSSGRSFADLSTQVGNADLPLVSAETDAARARAVAFVAALQRDDADLYERLGEVVVIEPSGFRVWDRDLEASLLLPDDGATERWRRVHALVALESWGRRGIRYADLRFTRRIVVLPREEKNVATHAAPATVTIQVKSQEIG